MFWKFGRKKLPTSTHQCFQLIYILSYHMGCLGCEIKNERELHFNKTYKIYAYIYRITYLAGLMGGIYYKLVDAKLNEAMLGHLTPVVKFVLTFEWIICPSVYVAITLYLDMYREEYMKLAKTLQDLDEELHKHFPGIQWNYDKTKRKYSSMTVGLYGFYAIFSSVYVFYIANCACGWISSAIVSICYAGVSGAAGCAGFLFIGNLDLLRLRFRLIRKLLRQHLLHSDNMEDISKFKLLENIFIKYSSLITLLNQVFCVITGSGLFHDFAAIASVGYLLCYQTLDNDAAAYEYACSILFMAPRIYKVINTALYGYATQKARRSCEHDIIKMGYLLKNSSSIPQQTELFLHWRMHNNYRVTVGKIIICNLGLIFLTLNSVVNYIMILIQLQFQQNNIVHKFITDKELINKNIEVFKV